MARDDMPPQNFNEDAGEIEGFQSGTYFGPRPSEWGKVLWPANDVHTHIHGHPDGVSISTFYPNGEIERFNLTTGKDETPKEHRK